MSIFLELLVLGFISFAEQFNNMKAFEEQIERVRLRDH
jgi:hypothetical protein